MEATPSKSNAKLAMGLSLRVLSSATLPEKARSVEEPTASECAS